MSCVGSTGLGVACYAHLSYATFYSTILCFSYRWFSRPEAVLSNACRWCRLAQLRFGTLCALYRSLSLCKPKVWNGWTFGGDFCALYQALWLCNLAVEKCSSMSQHCSYVLWSCAQFWLHPSLWAAINKELTRPTATLLFMDGGRLFPRPLEWGMNCLLALSAAASTPCYVWGKISWEEKPYPLL